MMATMMVAGSPARPISRRAAEDQGRQASGRICAVHALQSASGRDNVRPLTKEGARC
jgi:hypothetical protein